MDGYIAIPAESDGDGMFSAEVTYAEFVAKLVKPLDKLDHLNHMCLGCAGEVGELVDAIKKATIYGKELDRENVIEELGDLMFYMQGIMNSLKIDWDDIADHNILKLLKRYEKLEFSTEAAIARADKAGESNG